MSEIDATRTDQPSAKERSGAAIFLLDLDGRLLDANAPAAALVGRTVADLRDMPFAVLLPPDEPLVAQLQRKLWPEDRTFATALQRPQDLPVPVKLSFSRLGAGNRQQIIVAASARNRISADRQAASKLKVAVEQLQLAIETAKMGIWRFDAASGLMDANEELLTIYGIRRDQIRHDMAAYLAHVIPQDRQRVQEAMGSMLQGHHVRDIVFTIQRPDGEKRYLSVSAQPIYGADEQVVEMVGIAVDITKAKQREVALKESEAFLRAIFDSSLNGIMVCDDNAHIRSANRSVGELFGYRHDELVGMDLRRLQAGDMAGIRERVMAYLAAGQQVGEIALQRADGARRIVHYRAVRVGENFNLSILEDITARKQADEALRASEARYRTLFESANDFVFLHEFNAAGGAANFLEVNLHACERLGYSLEELRMLGPVDIITAMDREDVASEAEDLAKNRELIFEKKLVCRSGKLIPVELHARVFEHQGRQLVLSIGRDISERKQAAAALQRLNQAIEQSPVSVEITDADGLIRYVNPKFCETTGYSVPELLGQNPRILKSGKHSPEYYEELWATITAGKEWRGELCNRKKNGTLYWELASIAGVRGEAGTITHYVAVKEDITRRKQLEEERVRQERLASVGHLSAGIAHDFNNILASVVLYTRLALQSGTLSPANRERLETIDQQAWHASNLIDQILDFSRRGLLEKRSLDLLPLIQDHVRLLRRTLPENIQIELQHGPEPYTVHADPTRMQQIITNLAVNARDALPDGGKLTISLTRVAADADQPRLVPDLPAGDWIQLQFADNGIGIPDDTLPYIFEPFFTTKGPGEGSGLGLAQVHGIVGQHDGRIGVTTAAGEGTEFTIYLPAHVVAAPDHAAGDAGALPHGQGELLLVVEDEPPLREALAASLRALNYSVLEAANGAVALRLMAQQAAEIALVLSDVVMPVMGGKSLVRSMRERGWQTPIIFLTGHAGARDLDDLLAAELSGLLSKPFSMAHLARAIRTALAD